MKRKTLFPSLKITTYIVLFFCMVTSCGDLVSTVVFTEPQPADEKALTAFPERLQGKYVGNNGVSTIIISENLITRINDYEIGGKISDLDSTLYISGDELIDKTTGKKEKVTVRGDSVLMHIHEEDTIANIPSGNVLKKFKGYYFLNRGNKTEGWTVQRLALSDGKLTTAYISDSTACSKLDELAEKPTDTIPRQYTISKRKFKKFLKSDGFSDHDTFTRVR